MARQHIVDLRFIERSQQTGGQQAHPVEGPALVHDVAPVLPPCGGREHAVDLLQQAACQISTASFRPPVRQGGQLVAHDREGGLPDRSIIPAVRSLPEDRIDGIRKRCRFVSLHACDEGRGQTSPQCPDLIGFGSCCATRSLCDRARHLPCFGYPDLSARVNDAHRRRTAASAATRFPRHEMGRDLNRLHGRRLALDLSQKLLHGAIAHFEQRHRHAGQRRFLHRALRPIIEADDGDVLRNPDARLSERLHRT